MGKILRVDLSSSSSSAETLDPSVLYNFIGGRGVAAKILYDELKAKTDPLSPDNKLILMTGPVTATDFPGSGRISIASKSPLTGTIFDSSMGGTLGVHLKRAGFDGIIIEGTAERPSYLHVEDGRVKLRDASGFWGTTTTNEVEESLKKTHQGAGVATIGPAGENLAYMANIMHEGRTAGRGGLGAVMGGKRLKAIVAKGSQRVRIAHEEAYNRLLRKVVGSVEAHPIAGKDGALARFGTLVLVHRMAVADLIPKSNFSPENHLDYGEVDPFSGETVKERYLEARRACYLCPTGCGRLLKVGDHRIKGPEYETVAMLGPNAGFYNFEGEILPLSRMCDELGLDTISIGNILGFARAIGHISSLDDAKRLIMDIAYSRSMFGRGVRTAAETLEAKGRVAHVKGLELPAYDPRKAKGIALAYATSNRGGCHLRAYTIAAEVMSNPEFVDPQLETSKPKFVTRLQDAYAVYDCLVACKFHSFALFTSLEYEMDEIADLLTALTGFKFTGEGLRRTGGRIYALERLFNAREGYRRRDDELPEWFHIDLDKMLSEYYRERGWNSEGIPKGYPTLCSVSYAEADKPLLSPTLKIEPPQVQVALDIDADVETISRIAKLAYEGGAKVIEAGTPAIKRHGTDTLIPALRAVAPDAMIVADLKTMDVGNLEARIAFRSGADIVAVLAVSGINVIMEALSEAVRSGKMILIDFIGCSDPLSELGGLVDRLRGYERSVVFCLHRGVSEQLKGRGIHEERQLIAEARRVAGRFPLAVAGGIKEGTAKEIASLGVDIYVVGSAIYNSTDPLGTTRRILEEIRRGYVPPTLG